MFSVVVKYAKRIVSLSEGIVKKLRNIFSESQILYELVYGFLSEITPKLKSKSLDNSDLTDIGFLCREMENLFDELRKECKARKELCGAIIAYRLIQKSLTDPNITLRSKGKLATGRPNLKMQVALPKKFTDEYYQLTDFFGISRETAETGILRLDWNRVTEYCTQLSQDGKPIPKGFGQQIPSYSTIFTKRGEV